MRIARLSWADMKDRPRERRTKQLPIRLDDHEREAFEAAAVRAGLKMTDWIRTRCLAAAERETKEKKQ